jgi:hypothetical protein
MHSVAAMEASYRQHVVQRILLQTMPNFSSLLELAEEDDWPSFEEAQERFAAVKRDEKTERSSYLLFCDMLLADEYSYDVALLMHKAQCSLRRKDSNSLSSLWKLKAALLDCPTLLTQMPELMLRALRSVKKPAKPDTWGLILLSDQHRIPCAVCKSHVRADDSLRVRCLCCPFGYLAHQSCVAGKRCLVCSSSFHLTKLKAH